MKRIAILGSTGSIGQSTLEVMANIADECEVVGLSTNSRIDILYQQIKKFHPTLVCVKDIDAARQLQSRFKLKGVKLFTGEDGLQAMVKEKRVDKVILAISGSTALLPLLVAIENGKDVALANKEALVMAGAIIMNKARKKGVNILPIDSEQSAIWQCLDGEDQTKLKNIYLTASGGPFSNWCKKDLKNISIRQVLKHPRWKMGKKVTVDSATLMNKGLEILETMFLFNLDVDKIKVLIHPEAIIHSMVEFIDGVILAQLSVTDMRIPIQYAISYPARLTNTIASLDFYKLKTLHFEKPDFKRFPSLGLAYQVAREAGTAPCALNAANEISVEQFLSRKLDFVAIPMVIEKVLERHKNRIAPTLEEILEVDAWARRQAYEIIARLN